MRWLPDALVTYEIASRRRALVEQDINRAIDLRMIVPPEADAQIPLDGEAQGSGNHE